MQKTTKPKLNKELCPKKFEICVPESCQLLGEDWTKPEQWKSYLQKLNHQVTGKDVFPEGYTPLPARHSCDCKPCWVLGGELAVAHACNVHQRIFRQVLSLDKVSAIDVGFALSERQKQFDNLLAIRIHVTRKRPPELLLRAGLSSLTDYLFADDRLGGLGLESIDGILSSKKPDHTPSSTPSTCCQCQPSYTKLRRLLNRIRRQNRKSRQLPMDRYPVSGVTREDLSIFCSPAADFRSLAGIRLCICGVPIDIINAQYTPSITHPGGDANSGVFVKEPQTSDQLSSDELLLVGRGRVNPMVGGISVGTVTGQAGTLGTVVWDRTDATACMLSNWHVLAGSPSAQVGQPIYQPALFDGGTESDVVAHLKRWHLGEAGDVALAELAGNRHYAAADVLGFWHPVSGTLEPKLNMEIRKWGRTTGFTEGFIDGIHLAINIDYGNQVVRAFKDQFHIAPLYHGQDVSQVGDSGSLVVTRYKPVESKKEARDLRERLHQAESNAEQLLDWLRIACHQSVSLLCSKIPEQVEKWKKECKGLGKSCESLCETIETIAPQPNCESKQLDELCEHLADKHGEVKECCEDLAKRIAELSETAEKLQRLHDMLCEDNPVHPLEEVTSELQKLLTSLTKKHQQLQALKKGFAQNCSVVDLCNKLEQLIQCLRNEVERLCRCKRLGERVSDVLEHWSEECGLDGKICNLLDQCSKTGRCEDPAKVIACIEARLANPGLSESNEESSTKVPLEPHIKAQIEEFLEENNRIEALNAHATEYRRRLEEEEERATRRAYYAVGLIFAGDTPGSPMGEFAVASDIDHLADKLRFSLRPVFEPRSSFRELRVRPQQELPEVGVRRSRRGLNPRGGGADQRGGGPQPDVEPAQEDSGNG